MRGGLYRKSSLCRCALFLEVEKTDVGVMMILRIHTVIVLVEKFMSRKIT